MKPNIIVTCPDEHSIMALVKEGFGIALVPKVDSLDETSIHIHSIKDMDLFTAITCSGCGIAINYRRYSGSLNL